MRKIIIMLTVLITVFYSCKHNAVSPKNGSKSTTTTTTTTPTTPTVPTTPSNSVCFQTDVLPLFQTYCASTGCHNGTSTGEDGNFTLSTYADIMGGIVASNPSASRYYTVIKSGKMPPGSSPKLSAAQITTIATWINQGAQNTTCATTTCDTTKTTYSNGVSQIFATYCNGCHGIAPGSGNVVLSDYASAKTAGTSMKTNFLNAINYTSAVPAMNMPQSGQLSSCQVTQITKWINNGCPQ
ncbi:MAG: hypothetical protein ACHQIM_05070 [Sphingobacteriales bacterium]